MTKEEEIRAIESVFESAGVSNDPFFKKIRDKAIENIDLGYEVENLKNKLKMLPKPLTETDLEGNVKDHFVRESDILRLIN